MKQPPITIEARERANLDYHHGALRPAVGVQSFQVLRANREDPEAAEGTGWTYNHAPMLAYWNNRFYLEYLSNPIEEHVAPGHSLLTTSVDGMTWNIPRIVFPAYEIPKDKNPVLRDAPYPIPDHAVMHQRMGFHVAPNGRLLVLGFYGFCPEPNLLPFDNRGIGRVVREIHADGTWSPIHFIRYNRHAGWNESNTNYPFYQASDDPGFVEACDSILADSLIVQQWKEEHGDADELINLKGSYKALSFYTLPDGRVAGLWKWSLAGITSDRGKTWDWVGESPTLEHSGAKAWGQRTSDGRYAIVYNASTNNKHRWPLAIVTSDDGLRFSEMLLVAGEVPPRRYIGGAFKDCGMNYVRGIVEGNGAPPDGGLWVGYSMNKEDIWVSRIPAPVQAGVAEHIDDTFAGLEPGKRVPEWNTYSPLWAPVEIAAYPGPDDRSLKLEDADPYDHAMAERVFPESGTVTVDLSVLAGQTSGKPLYIELWDRAGQIPARVVFSADGKILLDHGRKVNRLGPYEAGRWYDLSFRVRAPSHRFEFWLDGRDIGRGQDYQGEAARDTGWYFRMSTGAVERLVLRTGPVRREPTIDMEVTEGTDLPNAGKKLKPSVFHIRNVRTRA